MMMVRSNRALLACIAMQAALLPCLRAEAQDAWSGSVAVTTEYIYRGISQSHGGSAAQGGVELLSPSSGWSLGVWGSTVDFGSSFSPGYEIDLHAARAWSLSPDWSFQLALTHYEYLDDPATDYDYDELLVSLSFQQRITASVGWSPDTSRFGAGRIAENRRALAYELTLLQPLSANWSICAGAGHYDLRELFGSGYWYWNTGLAFNWHMLQIDLSHIDTDETAAELFGYAVTGSRWTAAFTWRF
jgi:uncharacterized protein (TIGR02001 family)